jgi:hypothetical protein
MKHLWLIAGLLFCALPALAQQISGGTPPVLVLATTGTLTCCAGATTETFVTSLRIPGGSMGPNGVIRLECLWTHPNSANSKTFLYRFGATSGLLGTLISGAPVATTSATTQTLNILRNSNATNVQTAYPGAGSTPFGFAGAALVAMAIDTSADTFINIDATTASAGETVTLQHCVAMVMRAP